MKRNFPNIIDAWLEYMQHSSAPKTYQKWAMVSVVAGLLERKVWLAKDHDIGWYPNLYVFLVGPAGSGKSTVAETAINLMQEVEGINFLSTDLNEVSLFHDLKNIGARKRFDYGGINYPHSSATLFASEARTTFKEQYRGGGIIGAITNLFNGGRFGWSTTYGEGRSTRKEGKITVFNPCINLLACSTAEWLVTQCITKKDAEGGFGSRILLVVSKEELGSQNEWDNPSTAKDMQLRKLLVEDLHQVHQLKGPMLASLCFRDAWKECIEKYELWKERRVNSGVMSGYQQRKMTQLYKVAIVLAASRRQDMTIRGEDLRDAWAMLEEIEPLMVEVLDELEISKDAKTRREVQAYLTRRKLTEITVQELVRDFPRFDMAELNIAIQGLVALERLRPRPGSTRTFEVIKPQLSLTGNNQ